MRCGLAHRSRKNHQLDASVPQAAKAAMIERVLLAILLLSALLQLALSASQGQR